MVPVTENSGRVKENGASVNDPQASQPGGDASDGRMATAPGLLQGGISFAQALQPALVLSCLAGQASARQILYRHYRGRLARSILRLLGCGKRNLSLAEEIAHDTLSSLCEHDCHRLRVFNNQLGCLHAYLCALALQRVRLRYRQTHQPGYHEIPLGTYEPPDVAVTIHSWRPSSEPSKPSSRRKNSGTPARNCSESLCSPSPCPARPPTPRSCGGGCG